MWGSRESGRPGQVEGAQRRSNMQACRCVQEGVQVACRRGCRRHARGMHVGQHAAMQACRHAGMQHAGMQACRHGGMEACRHGGMQAWRHAGMQACRHAGLQACRPALRWTGFFFVFFALFFTCTGEFSVLHGRSASKSLKGISAPSPASREQTGSSKRDCAWARMAASAARGVHRRVRARAAAICAQEARVRLRTRAKRRMNAIPPLKWPPTSRPNTTRRQRPRPPGCSSKVRAFFTLRRLLQSETWPRIRARSRLPVAGRPRWSQPRSAPPATKAGRWPPPRSAGRPSPARQG